MTTFSNSSLNDLLVHKESFQLLLTKIETSPITKQEDTYEQEF